MYLFMQWSSPTDHNSPLDVVLRAGYITSFVVIFIQSLREVSRGGQEEADFEVHSGLPGIQGPARVRVSAELFGLD